MLGPSDLTVIVNPELHEMVLRGIVGGRWYERVQDIMVAVSSQLMSLFYTFTLLLLFNYWLLCCLSPKASNHNRFWWFCLSNSYRMTSCPMQSNTKDQAMKSLKQPAAPSTVINGKLIPSMDPLPSVPGFLMLRFVTRKQIIRWPAWPQGEETGKAYSSSFVHECFIELCAVRLMESVNREGHEWGSECHFSLTVLCCSFVLSEGAGCSLVKPMWASSVYASSTEHKQRQRQMLAQGGRAGYMQVGNECQLTGNPVQ